MGASSQKVSKSLKLRKKMIRQKRDRRKNSLIKKSFEYSKATG
jgi:hypothetical protein